MSAGERERARERDRVREFRDGYLKVFTKKGIIS